MRSNLYSVGQTVTYWGFWADGAEDPGLQVGEIVQLRRTALLGEMYGIQTGGQIYWHSSDDIEDVIEMPDVTTPEKMATFLLAAD